MQVESARRAVEPEKKLARTQGPFREPTDFSKPYQFPSQYLSSQIQDQEDDVRPNTRKSMGLSLASNDSLTKMAPLDEFVKIESEMKEADDDPNDRTVLNFHKMLKIVKEQLDDGSECRTVVKEMTRHRYEHFVLLISRTHLHLMGIYLLKADLVRIEKLWGSGPLTVRPIEVDSFWYYNVMTKEFVGAQRRAFQTNLDAVSL
jgi:hypothetical protein